MKIYGAVTCPDCQKVLQKINSDSKAIFVDILSSKENLKEFLNIRDREPCFDIVRESAGIGIPCFVSEEEVTLDMDKGMKLLEAIMKGDAK